MRKFLASMFVPAVTSVSLLAPFSPAAVAQTDPHLILRFPSVSKTQIVFNYGDDLWIVGRDGGEARPLISAVGIETVPAFSPDGTRIAFSGEYDGNVDVYVVPAAGARCVEFA
jgi:tricorn protease